MILPCTPYVTPLTRLLLMALLVFVANDADAQRRWWPSRETTPDPVEMISTRPSSEGIPVEIEFIRGPEHNHPLMAIWVEDLDSNYIQTLYVAESIGTGVFRHGDPSAGRWKPGPVRRPAALPYWGHQRGIRASDGFFIPTHDDPVPDAITGPTPRYSFILKTRIPENDQQQIRLLFEINQSWNWNEYWTNNKFPGNEHYMSSSQPALIYETIIDFNSRQKQYELVPVGHSHWAGENGYLYTDLSTITTALDITGSIVVRIQEKE